MTDNQAISFVDRCLEKHQLEKDAEIERLEKEISELKVKCIRSKAIKEFADRLKLDFGDDWGIVACGFDQLDQIAKEMGVEL